MKKRLIALLAIITFLTMLMTSCSTLTTKDSAPSTTANANTTTTATTTGVTSTTMAITTITTSESTPVNDIDHDGIDDAIDNQLIEKFAPVVKLSPEEVYQPARITWFLPRARMIFALNFGFDKQVLDKGKVTLTSLISQSYNNQYSGLSTSHTDFFLEATDISGGGSLDDYRMETRTGLPSQEWVCYARVRQSPGNISSYDIQYIFYYAYNGDLVIGPLNTEHESDFEHITVRVFKDQNTISQIYYAAHDNEGKWYKMQTSPGAQDGYSITADGHPVVYAALNSHASYPWAGKWQRNNLPDDHTAGDGLIWDCRLSVQNLGEKNYPAKDMQWIQYSGHWGEIGTQGFTTGPLSPAYQQWWDSDPE